jgi:hypothetical protein
MNILIGMATTEERYKHAQRVIKNLSNQGASIHLQVNSEDIDYTDLGKYAGLYIAHQKNELPDIYLTCDDDIVYPKNYVKRMVEAIEEHKCIVTYHGRKLTGIGKDYYNSHIRFGCLNEVDDNVFIDVAGTGVTGFATEYFNPFYLLNEPQKCMADLVFSLAAAKQDKQIKLLKHAKNMFKDLKIKKELTIFEQFNGKETPEQNELADQIYTLKRGLENKDR